MIFCENTRIDEGGYDHEKKELNQKEMEKAAGGYDFFDDHCIADDMNPHEFVKTGVDKEIRFYVFWSRHNNEYQCKKCGKRIWVW